MRHVLNLGQICLQEEQENFIHWDGLSSFAKNVFLFSYLRIHFQIMKIFRDKFQAFAVNADGDAMYMYSVDLVPGSSC